MVGHERAATVAALMSLIRSTSESPAGDGGVLFLTLALSAPSLVSGAIADSRGTLPHDGAVDRGCELARHVRLYRGGDPLARELIEDLCEIEIVSNNAGFGF